MALSSLPMLKPLLLNDVPISRACDECGVKYREFRWSPLWCPECDKKRVKRITTNLTNIKEQLDAKHS